MFKTVIVIPLFIISMFLLLISMDLLLGIPLTQSIKKVIKPFNVMEAGELTVIYIVLLVSLFVPLNKYFRGINNKKTRKN